MLSRTNHLSLARGDLSIVVLYIILLLLFLAEQWTDFTVIFASCWGKCLSPGWLKHACKAVPPQLLGKGLCSFENLTIFMCLIIFSFPSLAKTLKVAVAGRFAWQMEADKGHEYEVG